ncbi:MAG TPA: DUF2069 domain-containing protein [Xanthomonadaceae bacterium]|nr:DUF2069 domain-containing protein [Xanthomonadaceae bacterium]
MSARSLVLALSGALLLLQPAWYLWLSPPAVLPPLLATLLMALPIVPAIVLGLLGRSSAGFWAGVAALFYFSHGVMEAWANPAAAIPAGIEIVLAVALVFAASWRGLQARRMARSRAAGAREGDGGAA